MICRPSKRSKPTFKRPDNAGFNYVPKLDATCLATPTIRAIGTTSESTTAPFEALNKSIKVAAKHIGGPRARVHAQVGPARAPDDSWRWPCTEHSKASALPLVPGVESACSCMSSGKAAHTQGPWLHLSRVRSWRSQSSACGSARAWLPRRSRTATRCRALCAPGPCLACCLHGAAAAGLPAARTCDHACGSQQHRVSLGRSPGLRPAHPALCVQCQKAARSKAPAMAGVWCTLGWEKEGMQPGTRRLKKVDNAARGRELLNSATYRTMLAELPGLLQEFADSVEAYLTPLAEVAPSARRQAARPCLCEAACCLSQLPGQRMMHMHLVARAPALHTPALPPPLLQPHA